MSTWDNVILDTNRSSKCFKYNQRCRCELRIFCWYCFSRTVGKIDVVSKTFLEFFFFRIMVY